MSKPRRLNFTKSAFANLPPVTSRTTYLDARTRGLMLLATPSGGKTFYVRRKVDGRSERIYIGRYSEWPVERARARADEINAAIGRGENPADVRRRRRAEMTLDDLFNEYMHRNGPHLRRPDKPRNNYRLYLSHWGCRRLSTIKPHEVDRLHKDLARTKSNVTANIALKLLHVMFNKAIYEWRIWAGDNPAHGIRKLREVSRERFLVAREMPYFMMAVELEPNRAVRDLILLALLTGARRANLLDMCWADIDLQDREWRIPETKNGTPHLLPLCPEAAAILSERREKATSRWVFPGKGKTEHMVEPKRAWRRVLDRMVLLQLLAALCEKANWSDQEYRTRTERALRDVKTAMPVLCDELRSIGGDPTCAHVVNLRFHDLRRTLGSWQARTGASLTVIGKALHHKSPASTAVYARLDIDPVRVAIDRATTAMWRAGGLTTERVDESASTVTNT